MVIQINTICIIFTFRFPLAVSDVKVGFNFITTIIDTGAGIISTQYIGPDLETTVISGFPIFLQNFFKSLVIWEKCDKLCSGLDAKNEKQHIQKEECIIYD